MREGFKKGEHGIRPFHGVPFSPGPFSVLHPILWAYRGSPEERAMEVSQARIGRSLAGTIIIAAKAAGRLPSTSSHPIKGRSIMRDSVLLPARIAEYGGPGRRRRCFHPLGNCSAISPPTCAGAIRSARARIRGRRGRARLPRIQLLIGPGTLPSVGKDRMDLLRYRLSGNPRLTGEQMLEPLPEIAKVARVEVDKGNPYGQGRTMICASSRCGPRRCCGRPRWTESSTCKAPTRSRRRRISSA